MPEISYPSLAARAQHVRVLIGSICQLVCPLVKRQACVPVWQILLSLSPLQTIIPAKFRWQLQLRGFKTAVWAHRQTSLSLDLLPCSRSSEPTFKTHIDFGVAIPSTKLKTASRRAPRTEQHVHLNHKNCRSSTSVSLLPNARYHSS